MLVDSHVHIHQCYDIDVLLDAALKNFSRQATVDGMRKDIPAGCLALTETASDRMFAAMVHREPRWRPRRWTVEATGEECSLRCSSPDGRKIIVVAGSQIVTSERLEVLALATEKRYADGKSLRDTLATLARDEVPAVVPWGFGKWWMKRGRLLVDVLNASDPGNFFLGDNGGRPQLSVESSLLRNARRRGFRVLPGTDPFPFKSQQTKVGSYGFVLNEWQADDRPGAQLRQQLARLQGSPPAYGSRAGLAEFVALQLTMNVRTRLAKLA